VNEEFEGLEKKVNWDDLEEEQRDTVSFIFRHIFLPTLSNLTIAIEVLREKVALLDNSNVVELEGKFDEFIKNNKLVLADFYSDNCIACHRYISVFDFLSGKNGGVKFVRVNVDKHPELIERFNIDAIPVIMAFKNGMLSGKIVGSHPELHRRVEQVEGLIKKLNTI